MPRHTGGWGSHGGGARSVRKRASVVNEETLRWIDRDRQKPFFSRSSITSTCITLTEARRQFRRNQRGTRAMALRIDIDEYDAGLKYD